MKRLAVFIVIAAAVITLGVCSVFAADTGTFNEVMQPQTGEFISRVYEFLGATLIGLGIWLVRWLQIKIRGNVVGEALLNLALGWLQKHAEEPNDQVKVTDWLKAHKLAWITDADINAGMRGAMQKAKILSANEPKGSTPGTILPK